MKERAEKDISEEIIRADITKKEDIKKELEYCNLSLKEECDNLYNYQIEYFYWVNSRKDIMHSMKKDIRPCKNLKEIISFCDQRNYFLVEKLKMIRSSQLFIEDTLSSFDSINDFVELESIDTTLRIMMKSLGLNTPVEIFDLPF